MFLWYRYFHQTSSKRRKASVHCVNLSRSNIFERASVYVYVCTSVRVCKRHNVQCALMQLYVQHYNLQVHVNSSFPSYPVVAQRMNRSRSRSASNKTHWLLRRRCFCHATLLVIFSGITLLRACFVPGSGKSFGASRTDACFSIYVCNYGRFFLKNGCYVKQIIGASSSSRNRFWFVVHCLSKG